MTSRNTLRLSTCRDQIDGELVTWSLSLMTFVSRAGGGIVDTSFISFSCVFNEPKCIWGSKMQLQNAAMHETSIP